MKAWIVRHHREPERKLLVYADKPSEARGQAFGDPWEWGWADWSDLYARRVHRFDHNSPPHATVATNNDLAKGLPEFYDENYDG